MNTQGIEFPSVDEIYRRDPNVKEDDVQDIEEWLKTQPHLPELTQFQIIVFLHSCYYESPAARSTIEIYFTFRTTSYMFNDVDEDLVRRIFATVFLAFLPRKTADDDAVLLIKFIDASSEIYDCVESTKVLMAIITLYFHQQSPANGLVVVLDMEGASLGHLFKISISALKHFIYFLQEAAPVRLKSINLINTISITGRFVALARPFLKKETYNLLRCHNSLDAFYEVVPKEYLPKELGGLLPSILELQEDNLRNVVDHWNILQWHDTQKVDETKRIRKEKRLLGSWLNIFG